MKVIPLKNHENTTNIFSYFTAYRELLCRYCLAILAVVSFVCVRKENYSGDGNMPTQEHQRALFISFKIIFAYSYCYPMIASSTDLLIFHLLQEVANNFETWANLIKAHRLANSPNGYKYGLKSFSNATLSVR